MKQINPGIRLEPWDIHFNSVVGMRCSLFLISILIAFSCQKKSDFRDVKIIGHGASGLKMQNAIYHDNSKEAIDMYAGVSGCDGVEIDVQLSASGSLWLFHDEELSGETKPSGCIGSMSDDELKEIKYKSFHKEKLLALKEVPFEKLKGKTLMLDLRHHNACKNEIVSVTTFVQELNAILALQDGSIEVFVLFNIAEWQPYFENLPFETIYYGDGFVESEATLNTFPFDGVIFKNSQVSKEQVAKLKSAGKKVIIFEVRSPKGIRSALKKQPDYLMTDDVRATIIEKY